MLPKYVVVFLSLLFGLNCQKAEEDKFPDMPLFQNFKGPIAFERLSSTEEYRGHNSKYIFFEIHRNNTKTSLVVYDLKTKNEVKEIALASQTHIDQKGKVYIYDDNRKLAYLYEEPKYHPETITETTLHIPEALKGENSTLERNIKEQYIKEHYLKELNCVVKFSHDLHLFKYKKKNQLIKSEVFYTPTLGLPIDGLALPYCSTLQKDETILQSNFLTQIDSAHLGGSWSGSNHFAFGYSSQNLYYYELSLFDKKVRFKSPRKMTGFVNMKQEHILNTGFENFRIKEK